MLRCGIFMREFCIINHCLQVKETIKLYVMTVKELFSRYSFTEIAPAFKHLWQINASQQAVLLDMDGWEEIYQSLQALEAKPSEYFIILVSRWEYCNPMIDMNCSVHRSVDKQRECPLSSYPHWSEIMGMEITIDEDVQITPPELTAGLLWEITYYGGTEKALPT